MSRDWRPWSQEKGGARLRYRSTNGNVEIASSNSEISFSPMSPPRSWRSEAVKRFIALVGEADPIEGVKRRVGELVHGLLGPPFNLSNESVLRAVKILEIRYNRAVPGDGRIFLRDDGYIVEINSSRPEP